MATQKKRKKNPTTFERPFKKQRQLTLYSFYNTLVRDSRVARKAVNYQKNKRKKKKEQTLHHHFIYDIPAANLWYVQLALKHVFCVLERININKTRREDSSQYVRKPSTGLHSLTEYIAMQKLLVKLRHGEEILYYTPTISTRKHSNTIHSAGTEQKDSINKLVMGFIRTHFEDIFKVEMPQDLKNTIPSWYGNIIMTSKFVNLSHIQFIGYALKEMLPDINHFKLHETFRFQDNGHDIRFVVTMQTNTGDILVHFHGYEEDNWSLLLQTSVQTIPVKYTWNRIYHVPNDFVFHSNMKFTDIFSDWIDSMDVTETPRPLAGIGSLLTHNLMKPEHSAIVCTQFEVFLFE